ncbi:hypothetical protein C8R43DRAFT_84679 [Mycena crocata]|nr:hypothetical protein C8R43DRAFT_84679 [Mycena crocata]
MCRFAPSHLHSTGGCQFNPSTITASNGTVISFRFLGLGNHSVTQSNFIYPCTPMAGGFNSGIHTKTSTWNHTVKNDQNPVWFYCRQDTPRSHCDAAIPTGTVGAINIQVAEHSFADFQKKAEDSTIPAGEGSSSSGTAFTVPSGAGSIKPSEIAAASRSVPVSTIVGACVGALALLTICAALLFSRCRLRRRQQFEEVTRPQPYEKTSLPPEPQHASMLFTLLREIRTLRRQTRAQPPLADDHPRPTEPPPRYSAPT